MKREEVAKIIAEKCHEPVSEEGMALTIFVEAMVLPPKRVMYTKEMLETIIYDNLLDKGIYATNT